MTERLTLSLSFHPFHQCWKSKLTQEFLQQPSNSSPFALASLFFMYEQVLSFKNVNQIMSLPYLKALLAFMQSKTRSLHHDLQGLPFSDSFLPLQYHLLPLYCSDPVRLLFCKQAKHIPTSGPLGLLILLPAYPQIFTLLTFSFVASV